MTQYEVVRAEICYDPARGNGHYFADVAVNVVEDEDVGLGRGRIEQLEVILNGPGVQKALRKINSQLSAKGLETGVYMHDITPLKRR